LQNAEEMNDGNIENEISPSADDNSKEVDPESLCKTKEEMATFFRNNDV